MSYEPQYSLERDDDHPDNYSQFSGIFAPMYVCPEHGETWHVETAEEIDTEHDEVYEHHLCSHCHRDVTPLLHDGHPVMHPLTDEEAYWESSSPFFNNDDEEEGYNFTCETCGGEFWDGGTSCTCGEEE